MTPIVLYISNINPVQEADKMYSFKKNVDNKIVLIANLNLYPQSIKNENLWNHQLIKYSIYTINYVVKYIA